MNLLKFCTLIVLFVLVSCNFDKQDNLCTSPRLDELIDTQHVANQEVQKLWSELKEKGHFSRVGSDAEMRPQFVTMQFMFESAVASMLEQNQISRAIAVIHTPTPPTPLRTDGIKLDGLMSEDAIADPERFNTLTIRHKSLHNYLSSGGVLYAIYKNIVKVPGIAIYKNNIKQYPNTLVDKPVSAFDEGHIGASYLIECENGQHILFAISGRQLNDTKDGSWTLQYGSVDNKDISQHIKVLRNIYSKHGVNFDF